MSDLNQTDNWDLVGTVKMFWRRFGFANIPIDENDDGQTVGNKEQPADVKSETKKVGKASIPSKSVQPRPSLKNNKKMRILKACLLYTSPSPRDRTRSRMPSSA